MTHLRLIIGCLLCAFIGAVGSWFSAWAVELWVVPPEWRVAPPLVWPRHPPDGWPAAPGSRVVIQGFGRTTHIAWLIRGKGWDQRSDSWHMYRATAGWPFRSIAASVTREVVEGRERTNVNGLSPPRWAEPLLSKSGLVLPLRPLFPGFILNIVFYGLFAFALWRAPGWTLRTLRRGRGQCSVCGYELQGSVGGVCPECGVLVRKRSR